MIAGKALSWIKQVSYSLDDLRQRSFYERPNRVYREKLMRESSWPDFRQKGQRLCDDGILILPRHFAGDALEEMRKDFAGWISQGVPSDEPGSLQINEKQGASLRNSEAFSRAAVDPWITALASYYWGKPILLAHSFGTRLQSDPSGNGLGPFQWHHDAHRKQLKAMIYLDDVSLDGQRMDYLPGTQRIWHRFQRGESGYQETRLSNEEVICYGEPLRCEGPAGTVVLFDTNGIHRGNRNRGPKRDTWVFQYTAGRHLESPCRLHLKVVRELTPEQKRLARQFA